MYSQLKQILGFLSIIVLAYSCYTPSTINSRSIDSQYPINYRTMSIGDSSFLSNDTLWTKHDFTGDGIHGRKVIYRDHSNLTRVTAGGSGKIFVDVCIDREGVPAFVRIESNTTIDDKNTLGNALKMISGYRFEADTTAQEYQCGMIKLFLDINTF